MHDFLGRCNEVSVDTRNLILDETVVINRQTVVVVAWEIVLANQILGDVFVRLVIAAAVAYCAAAAGVAIFTSFIRQGFRLVQGKPPLTGTLRVLPLGHVGIRAQQGIVDKLPDVRFDVEILLEEVVVFVRAASAVRWRFFQWLDPARQHYRRLF